MKRVLVLCIGNSCRSQMAEGYLRFYGGGKAQYFSAGLSNHGVNPNAIEVMAEDSIDISSHTSKTIENFKDQHFDYILSVCEEGALDIPDFVTADQYFCYHVPDPAAFVGSKEAALEQFRGVREMLKTHMLKFIGKELTEREAMVA